VHAHACHTRATVLARHAAGSTLRSTAPPNAAPWYALMLMLTHARVPRRRAWPPCHRCRVRLTDLPPPSRPPGRSIFAANITGTRACLYIMLSHHWHRDVAADAARACYAIAWHGRCRLASHGAAVACRRVKLVRARGAFTHRTAVLSLLVIVPRHALCHVTLNDVAPADRAAPRPTRRASPIRVIAHVWRSSWSPASRQACHCCSRTVSGLQLEFSPAVDPLSPNVVVHLIGLA
jgi:hypothetical protein